MTDLHWDTYARMFDDCGKSLWVNSKELCVEREIALDRQDEGRRKLRAREISETVMSWYYDAENACKDAELDREGTDWVINYWLTGLASSPGEATRDEIRDLITNFDTLKVRVQQAVEENDEKDEWDADFEERQRRRDERE